MLLYCTSYPYIVGSTKRITNKKTFKDKKWKFLYQVFEKSQRHKCEI